MRFDTVQMGNKRLKCIARQCSTNNFGAESIWHLSVRVVDIFAKLYMVTCFAVLSGISRFFITVIGSDYRNVDKFLTKLRTVSLAYQSSMSQNILLVHGKIIIRHDETCNWGSMTKEGVEKSSPIFEKEKINLWNGIFISNIVFSWNWE